MWLWLTTVIIFTENVFGHTHIIATSRNNRTRLCIHSKVNAVCSSCSKKFNLLYWLPIATLTVYCNMNIRKSVHNKLLQQGRLSLLLQESAACRRAEGEGPMMITYKLMLCNIYTGLPIASDSENELSKNVEDTYGCLLAKIFENSECTSMLTHSFVWSLM